MYIRPQIKFSLDPIYSMAESDETQYARLSSIILPYKSNFHPYVFIYSVVGIAIGYELDDRGVGVEVPGGSRIFSTSSKLSLWSTQLPGLFSRV
jgi:hypothetical protein